ncbi:hypothetical protein B0F90DRAFT_1757066 [Multifurca ochricompacta]|uniref:Uncharacterized protein n=1 Tax=Multifurca ochricompacta TaxID=376703 RepID=A0AAD4QKI4_9AGAM|nr:hypothetical protein B0F90DRAFT_1757066 [Multifurca ochricompacta]
MFLTQMKMRLSTVTFTLVGLAVALVGLVAFRALAGHSEDDNSFFHEFIAREFGGGHDQIFRNPLGRADGRPLSMPSACGTRGPSREFGFSPDSNGGIFGASDFQGQTRDPRDVSDILRDVVSFIPVDSQGRIIGARDGSNVRLEDFARYRGYAASSGRQ